MDMKYIDDLMWEIKKCREELHDAHLEYDIADEDMIDYVTYKIKALNAKYEALSRRLKNHVYPKEMLERIEKKNKGKGILKLFNKCIDNIYNI